MSPPLDPKKEGLVRAYARGEDPPPSDPPGGFPPETVRGVGSRSPTIDRGALPRSWVERLGLAKVLWGVGVAIVTWVGARVSSVREDLRAEMIAVAASAAASAVQHKFEDHPPDAFGHPQASLGERLEGAAGIVQWTGRAADAQARTDHEVADLKNRVVDLEAKGKKK